MAQGMKRFVDIEIKKETALLSAVGFGVPILLTIDVTAITTITRVKEYLSLAAVELDFADTTDEYEAAKAYFNQDPFNKTQPEKLLIGCWDRDNVTPEVITDALQAIRDANDEWYAMGITADIRDDVPNLTLLATEIEAMRKVLILDSNDTEELALTDVTSILYTLREQGTSGFKRTMVCFHNLATTYPSWSVMGKFLPLSPGKSQIAYQILADASAGATFIPAANITEVQKDNLFVGNGNTTVGQSGQVFFYPGVMVGGKNLEREGEWFDIIRGIDFLQARVEEGLLSLLLEKSNAGSKVPFTDAGIAMMENRLRNLLDVYGVQQGILVDGTVAITVPKRSDTTSDDRDDRILRDVDFTASLAGAIGKVIVRGKVSI